MNVVLPGALHAAVCSLSDAGSAGQAPINSAAGTRGVTLGQEVRGRGSAAIFPYRLAAVHG